MRSADMDGDKERTLGFGTAGSIFTSKHSFVKGLPSYLLSKPAAPAKSSAYHTTPIAACSNPAMTFRYWINPKAGVEMIENEAPASFDIYNLQEVCVLRNASIDDLRSLPKGIYIANQRKYLVH